MSRKFAFFGLLLALRTDAQILAGRQPVISQPTAEPLALITATRSAQDSKTTVLASLEKPELVKRAEVKSMAGYTYLGCWQDGSDSILAVTNYIDSAMTPELCRNKCQLASCNMFGIEYQVSCFCGNALEPFAVTATQDTCTQTCYGDKSALCGNLNRMVVYSATTDFPAGSQIGTMGFVATDTKAATSTAPGSGSSSTGASGTASPSSGASGKADASANASSNSSSSSSSSSASTIDISVGAIAGIAIGAAAVSALITALIAFFICGRRRGDKTDPPMTYMPASNMYGSQESGHDVKSSWNAPESVFSGGTTAQGSPPPPRPAATVSPVTNHAVSSSEISGDARYEIGS